MTGPGVVDWAALAVVLAQDPPMVRRLLVDHVPADPPAGRDAVASVDCRVCHAGWPCTVRAVAQRAAALGDEQPVPGDGRDDASAVDR